MNCICECRSRRCFCQTFSKMALVSSILNINRCHLLNNYLTMNCLVHIYLPRWKVIFIPYRKNPPTRIRRVCQYPNRLARFTHLPLDNLSFLSPWIHWKEMRIFNDVFVTTEIEKFSFLLWIHVVRMCSCKWDRNFSSGMFFYSVHAERLSCFDCDQALDASLRKAHFQMLKSTYIHILNIPKWNINISNL